MTSRFPSPTLTRPSHFHPPPRHHTKITEEESSFDAAKTIHEGQHGPRAAKVIPHSDPPITVADGLFSSQGKRLISKSPCTLLAVYFPLLSLVPCISKKFHSSGLISASEMFVRNHLRLESDGAILNSISTSSLYSIPTASCLYYRSASFSVSRKTAFANQNHAN